jgi:hypothetical protein
LKILKIIMYVALSLFAPVLAFIFREDIPRGFLEWFFIIFWLVFGSALVWLAKQIFDEKRENRQKVKQDADRERISAQNAADKAVRDAPVAGKEDARENKKNGGGQDV